MLSKWVLRDLEEFYTSCGWTLERGESGGREGEGGGGRRVVRGRGGGDGG